MLNDHHHHHHHLNSNSQQVTLYKTDKLSPSALRALSCGKWKYTHTPTSLPLSKQLLFVLSIHVKARITMSVAKSSINIKSQYLQIDIYWTWWNYRLKGKTCSAAGETQGEHPNHCAHPKNTDKSETKAAPSRAAAHSWICTVLTELSAGTSTSLQDLHYAQHAGLRKLRRTCTFSFIDLWTSRSTWQLGVLCANVW